MILFYNSPIPGSIVSGPPKTHKWRKLQCDINELLGPLYLGLDPKQPWNGKMPLSPSMVLDFFACSIKVAFYFNYQDSFLVCCPSICHQDKGFCCKSDVSHVLASSSISGCIPFSLHRIIKTPQSTDFPFSFHQHHRLHWSNSVQSKHSHYKFPVVFTMDRNNCVVQLYFGCTAGTWSQRRATTPQLQTCKWFISQQYTVIFRHSDWTIYKDNQAINSFSIRNVRERERDREDDCSNVAE